MSWPLARASCASSAALTAPCIDWKREDVAARVKEIVSVHLNLKESEYSEEKRFIEDLGAG